MWYAGSAAILIFIVVVVYVLAYNDGYQDGYRDRSDGNHTL